MCVCVFVASLCVCSLSSYDKRGHCLSAKDYSSSGTRRGDGDERKRRRRRQTGRLAHKPRPLNPLACYDTVGLIGTIPLTTPKRDKLERRFPFADISALVRPSLFSPLSHVMDVGEVLSRP